jgi:hypothetical protein
MNVQTKIKNENIVSNTTTKVNVTTMIPEVKNFNSLVLSYNKNSLNGCSILVKMGNIVSIKQDQLKKENFSNENKAIELKKDFHKPISQIWNELDEKQFSKFLTDIGWCGRQERENKLFSRMVSNEEKFTVHNKASNPDGQLSRRIDTFHKVDNPSTLRNMMQAYLNAVNEVKVKEKAKSDELKDFISASKRLAKSTHCKDFTEEETIKFLINEINSIEFNS